MIVWPSVLRWISEIVLLFIMVETGLRNLPGLAISFLVFRLGLGCISRILQKPGLLNKKFKRRFKHVLLGFCICFLKIYSETIIFLSIREDTKEDINIQTGVIILILFFIVFRNISDTLSLLAIEFDEFNEL